MRMTKGTAWITGASSGIGRAIALELDRSGWRVGVGARREESLSGLGEAAAVLDVCDSGAVARWAAALRGCIGEPDLVVQAAGWGVFEKVQETSEEDWERTLRTNLTGMFLVTRETLPAMLTRGSGHFVNILSVAARTAFPKNAAYNASKYGALGFTEALRAEVRRQGIRVTAVLPGATDTPFWDRLAGEWDRTKMMPPAAVARAVREAAEAGPESLIEEIRITPPLGNL
jgi:3-oxoacyl-[acyl-carrier protein] reductase